MPAVEEAEMPAVAAVVRGPAVTPAEGGTLTDCLFQVDVENRASPTRSHCVCMAVMQSKTVTLIL